MQYNRCKSKFFFLLSPLFIALTACGGGGGGSSSISFNEDDDGCSGETEYRACGEVKDVQIASDANGNVTVVWVEENDENRLVQSSRNTSGNNWSRAERVSAYEADVATELSNPEIATNDAGTILAVFRILTQADGEQANQIVAIPYYPNKSTEGDPDAGWERNGVGYVITEEESNALSVANPDVAIEENDDGLAVWSSGDGSEQRIKASRFNADTEQSADSQRDSRWGTPAVVGADEATNGATNPQVVIDGDGNALVVWRAGDSIRAARFSADSDDFTSAEVEDIGSEVNGNPSAPRIAIDASGNAVAIWEENDSVVTSRYDQGTSIWGPAEERGSAISGDASIPSIASSDDGRMVAAWRVGENVIVASDFIGGSWQTAEQISDNSAVNNVGNPEVAIAANGSARAVWSRTETEMGVRNIVASERAASGDWSAPTAVESQGGDATLPKITIDGNSRGTAAWLQVDTNDDSNKKVRTGRL